VDTVYGQAGWKHTPGLLPKDAQPSKPAPTGAAHRKGAAGVRREQRGKRPTKDWARSRQDD
jgi:hypothetical protein